MTASRLDRRGIAALLCLVSLSAGAAPANHVKPADPLEPARAALRTLQFDRAVVLLTAAGKTGNADAERLLGLMYLNGVGVGRDEHRARELLESAAAKGNGMAAYVLAGELSHDPGAPDGAARQWLERSAHDGYTRAQDALKSSRPLLDRESVGKSDASLLIPWVIESVRRNDAAELRRLGSASIAVRDDFGRSALCHAAEAGSLEAATALLDLGADARSVDRAGVTALMIAAEQPDRGMVELLLLRGADAHAVDAEQRTVLFYAARANRVSNLGPLQRAGTELDARDSRGYNALDAGLGVGAEEAVAALRAMGLHPNRIAADAGRLSGKFDPAHPGDLYRGWTPLALAVSRNDASTVQQLLAAGGDARLRLPQGDPLLQVAADAHALQCLALLLAHGADPAAADHSGHGVMWLAASRTDLPVVKALLAGGVRPDVHAAGEINPLFAALRAKRSEVTAALLAAGADIEATDLDGRTPLMLAAADGEGLLVQTLLERHARVDAEDRRQRSALWYAAAAGSPDVTESLLSAGAVSKADLRGVTPLHAAAAQTNAGVLAPLLAKDKAVDRRDEAGDTALVIAAAKGHTEVVRMLLERRPDLNVQNDAGDTALIAASRGGYAEICRLLAAAGANRALRNAAGISAADVADGRGFARVAKDLRDKG